MYYRLWLLSGGQHFLGLGHFQSKTKLDYISSHKKCLEMLMSTSASWFDNVMINHEMSLKVTMLFETFSVNHHFEITRRSLVAFVVTHVLSWHVRTYHEFLWHVTNHFREVVINICNTHDKNKIKPNLYRFKQCLSVYKCLWYLY